MSGLPTRRPRPLSVSQRVPPRSGQRSSALASRHPPSPLRLSSAPAVNTERSGEFSGGEDEVISVVSLPAATASDTLVKPFQWSSGLGLCGVRPGIHQLFCIRSNCSTHAGRSPDASLIEGGYYVPTRSGTKAYLQPSLGPSDLDESNAITFLSTPRTVLQMKAAFERILESKSVEATLDAAPYTGDVLKQTLAALRDNDANSDLVKALWKTPGKKLKEAFEDGTSTPAIDGLITELLTQFPWDIARDDELETDDFDFATPGSGTEGDPNENLQGEDAARIKLLRKLGRGMSITARTLEFLENDLDALRQLIGSSITSVQNKIGTDTGLDPDSAGELTVWEGLIFLQGDLTAKLNSLQQLINTSEERSENMRVGFQALRDKVDCLHQRMDHGAVGLRDGKGRIPNLIPTDESDIPGSFFSHVWEIVDYAIRVLEEDQNERSVLRDDDSRRGPDDSRLELNAAAETAALENRLDELALKVGALEGNMDNMVGVIDLGEDLRFDGYDDVFLFVEECNESAPLPKHVIGGFMDLWVLLDYIAPDKYGKGSNQTSTADFTRKRADQIKIEMKDYEVEILTGLTRDLPCTFEPVNTPETTDVYLRPFHSLQNYQQWNNSGSTANAGRRQRVNNKLTTITIVLERMMKLLFRKHPKLHKLAKDFFDKACSQKSALFTWIDKQYSTEKGTSTAEEAWRLVAGCVSEMFLNILLVRVFDGDSCQDDPVTGTALAIWHFGGALMRFDEYIRIGFTNHQVCQAVYTTHMNRSRATKNEVEKMQTSLESQIQKLQKELTAATKKISALEKKNTSS